MYNTPAGLKVTCTVDARPHGSDGGAMCNTWDQRSTSNGTASAVAAATTATPQHAEQSSKDKCSPDAPRARSRAPVQPTYVATCGVNS